MNINFRKFLSVENFILRTRNEMNLLINRRECNLKFVNKC